MTTLNHEIYINAPKSQVWDVIANLGGIVKFHPLVTNSYYVTDDKQGTGAARVCEFGPDTSVNETAIAWNEGESYTLDVQFIKGQKPPVHSFHGSLSLREHGSGTVVGMTLEYAPKFGPLGKIMDVMLLRPKFNKLVSSVLKGLKHHIETGESVDPQVLSQIERSPATS